MAVSKNEDVLLTGAKSGRVRVWRLSSHPVDSHLCDDKSRSSSSSKLPVFAATILSTGSVAATCDQHMLAIWDIQASKRITKYVSLSHVAPRLSRRIQTTSRRNLEESRRI
jgi:WD40 repeat protein